MDEKRFNELFELSDDDLEQRRVTSLDRWTWDTGTDADKQEATDCEIFQEARKRTGLHK